MKTDLEICNQTKLKHITKVGKKLGLKKKNLVLYGDYVAKINNYSSKKTKQKLVLVTAINPTKSGNGKTTVSIGLADALSKLKKKVCLALREPSLGPVFGMKGGAAGGGYSQVAPMQDINLHFSGDFHAITSANNLLCSMIDNHIFQGNELNIDPNTVFVPRCLDCNDRALRDITINSTYNRKENFVITAASEIMAIMCVSKDVEDLTLRLGNILIALTKEKKPVYAKDIQAHHAMAILLKDALKPNLVQTLEHTPAIVHCGPFANIAHGCNSIVATRAAMALADYTITEAGFGADLGAEKFFDFKCRTGDLNPNCVVLVATISAIKLHGGATDTSKENLKAIKKGLCNVYKHIDTIQNVFKLPLVVAINQFACDTQKEINYVKDALSSCRVVCTSSFENGGSGAVSLAKEVIMACQQSNKFSFVYELEDSTEQKIDKIVKNVYGGTSVEYSKEAKSKLKLIKKFGYDNLPVIIAKTQYSLSDDPLKLGAPNNFDVQVRDIHIRSGAGFLVVVCGKIMLMPGLGKVPAAAKMKIDNNSSITGLF